MINNSPWLWNDNKTAAGMTTRTSRGQRIIQGKRTKGQSNPSEAYLLSQRIAAVIWPYFRYASGFIKQFWTRKTTGQTAASQFYAYTYDNAMDTTDPMAPVIVPADLKFATGTMTPTPILTLTGDVSDNEIRFTWTAAPSDDSQNSNDAVWYVLRNRTKNIWRSGSISDRSSGDSGAIVPGSLNIAAGDIIDLYANFLGVEGEPNAGLVSDSAFKTATVTA